VVRRRQVRLRAFGDRQYLVGDGQLTRLLGDALTLVHFDGRPKGVVGDEPVVERRSVRLIGGVVSVGTTRRAVALVVSAEASPTVSPLAALSAMPIACCRFPMRNPRSLVDVSSRTTAPAPRSTSNSKGGPPNVSALR
jgi:hypothetical protein